MDDFLNIGPESSATQNSPALTVGTGSENRDPDLAGLTVLHGLSIRAFNVCRGAQLDHLSSIRQFSERHGGFQKLRNCGKKTIQELEDLLAKCTTAPSTSTPTEEGYFSSDQIQRIYMQYFTQLGPASREALTALTGPPVARTGINLFMRSGEALNGLPDMPEAVLKELRHMRRALFQALDRRRHALRVAKLKSAAFDLDQWFQFHDLSMAARAELFTPSGSMTLLRFMDHYLEQFDHHNAYRLLLHTLHQPGANCTTTELARQFDLTPERVRQILVKTEARLRKPFEVIADLPDVQYHYPELLAAGPVFMVTKELVDKLNKRDRTQFSPLAVLYVAHAVDPYKLVIGSWTALFGPDKHSFALNSEQLFMIDPLLVQPAAKKIAVLAELLKKKRKHQEAIKEADLMKDVDRSIRPRLLASLKQLVAIRWPEIDLRDDQFILPANKMKFNDDRLEEVLLSLNEPSHVSVVMEEWERRFPDHPVTAPAISNMIVHNKTMFMSIGWTSTYGLRRWEKDRPELNMGSIRTFVYHLLEFAPTPLHKDELEEAVKRVRQGVTGSGIFHNLRLDKSGIFLFFSGGYVGLAQKSYDHVPAPPPNVPGHLLRAGNLSKFIGKPRNLLAEHLMAECHALPNRVALVIDRTIADGRLVVDENGVIRSVHEKRKSTK